MKKFCTVLFHIICMCLLTTVILTVSVQAEKEPPRIVMQPQNPNFVEGGYASYTVEAGGTNLTCTWYLEFEGDTYNISETTDTTEPWEQGFGIACGSFRDGNSFTYFFDGIQYVLNGAKIYCVIEDGHYSVTSDKAIITVAFAGSPQPPQILTVTSSPVIAKQGEFCNLYCIAVPPNEEKLSYIWYETWSGRLQDIRAISMETDTENWWYCDTSELGTRYYVCGVITSTGGIAYTNVIPVTIKMPFYDVEESAWYYNTIESVYKLGLMTGTGEWTFEPEDPMTRAMLVSVLYRMEGKPVTSYQQLFSDVAKKQWYTSAVIWAANNKVVNGYDSDGTFRPNDNITREQVAVIIRNYVKSLGIKTTANTDLKEFKDGGKVSTWSKSAVAWAVENGIMSGTKEGTLRPQGEATRAECAKMLLKAYELIQRN